MEGEYVQLVLRCEHCNKPFDKESVLKRHGYYCRSRRAGSVTTRSRSCVSCAKAKARCDNRLPECSRCLSKIIKCHYPTTAPRDKRPRDRNHDEVHVQQQVATSLSAINFIDAQYHENAEKSSDIVLDTTLDVPDLNFADFEVEYFGSGFDFAELLQANDQDVQNDTSHSSMMVSKHQGTYCPQMSIQSMPTCIVRSFDQRPKLKTSAQRTTKLILHTLKSYPLMMLRDKSLPPFIHPHIVHSDTGNQDMESLNNCISLMHMISSQIHGSRKLFWRNVRMECERLSTNRLTLSKWELLAAMQAVYVYILVRLSEGETEHNNLDSLLISTVMIISVQFNDLHANMVRNMQSVVSDDGLKTSWKDWIFEESMRRICVMYQVVNMLVYFEPAAMCDLQQIGLLLAPLPAKKQLWEANDEFAWKARGDEELEMPQMAFGLTTDGDLVRVDQRRLPYNHDISVSHSKSLNENIPADWEEWCSGMDGLGPLVMLAASLAA